MPADYPPIDRLADYYPPRPGHCNSTNVPHIAAETYVLYENGYFDGSKRICHIHLLVKCNVAVWPKVWRGGTSTPSGPRPPPKELREWPHAKPASPDD